VAGVAYGTGRGRSKKEAEQNAAQEAFESLAASRMITGTGAGSGNGQGGVDRPGVVPADKPAGTT